MAMTGVARRFAFFEVEFGVVVEWLQQAKIQALGKQQTLTSFGEYWARI